MASARYGTSHGGFHDRVVSESDIQEMVTCIHELERTTAATVSNRNQTISELSDKIQQYRRLLRQKEEEVDALTTLVDVGKKQIDPNATEDQTLCELIEQERSLVIQHIQNRRDEYEHSIRIIRNWGSDRQEFESHIARIQKQNQEMKEKAMGRLLELHPNPGQPLHPPGGFQRSIYDRYDSLSDDEVKFTLQAKLDYFFQIQQQLDAHLSRFQAQIDEVEAGVHQEKLVEDEIYTDIQDAKSHMNEAAEAIQRMTSCKRFRFEPSAPNKQSNIVETIKTFEMDVTDEFEVREEELSLMRERIHFIQSGAIDAEHHRISEECGRTLGDIVAANAELENIRLQMDDNLSILERLDRQFFEADSQYEEISSARSKVSDLHSRNMITYEKLALDLQSLNAYLNSVENQHADAQEDLRIISTAVFMIVECVRGVQDSIAVQYHQLTDIQSKARIVHAEYEEKKGMMEQLQTREEEIVHEEAQNATRELLSIPQPRGRTRDFQLTDERHKDPSLSNMFASIRSRMDRITEKAAYSHAAVRTKEDYVTLVQDQAANIQVHMILKDQQISVINRQLDFGIKGLTNIWKIICHVLQQLPPLPMTQSLLPAKQEPAPISRIPSAVYKEPEPVKREFVMPAVVADKPPTIISPKPAPAIIAPPPVVLPPQPLPPPSIPKPSQAKPKHRPVEPDLSVPPSISRIYIPPPDMKVEMNLQRIVEEYYIQGRPEEGCSLDICGGWISDDIFNCEYEWSRRLEGGSNFLPIPGATCRQYIPTMDDINCFLRCTIWHGQDVGHATTAKIREGHPSLLSLMVSGGPYHTTPLEVIYTYVGGYEGKSLFQWLRSDNDMPFKPIPGATQPTYYANPDDLHTLLRVEVVPVREDGVRGESMYADVNPKFLTMDPEVAHTVETNVRNGKAAFRVQMKISGSNQMEPRILVLVEDHIKIQKNQRTRQKISFTATLAINIDVLNKNRFSLTDESGVHEFEAENSRVRDVIVLVMRSYQGTRLIRLHGGVRRVRSLSDIQSTNASRVYVFDE